MDKTEQVLCDILIKKLGYRVITELLSGNASVVKETYRGRNNLSMFQRGYSNESDVLLDWTNSDGEEIRHTPQELLSVLADSMDEFNYSNFHERRLSIIAEIVFRYCQEHNIPLGIEVEEKADDE